MEFSQVWSHLSTSSRSWLLEHSGEPLPDDAVDWIEAVANDES